MEALALRLVTWLRRLFGPPEPALPPIGADQAEILEAVSESRRLAEQSRAASVRVERLAKEQQAHLRYLEDKLRLYTRADEPEGSRG